MNSDDQDATTRDASIDALPTRRRAIKTFGGLAVAAFVPGALRAAWGEDRAATALCCGRGSRQIR
jgi:hypothetical protein